jgi:glycosyltransferase involved in cell wall biosynthesis
LGAFSHKDLPGIMEKTDLFLLSSVLEGQPLALVEAMAYSCPIVATSVGGIPELIQDGVNGFLCPPGNPECLAEKVMELVENPRLRKQMGAEARRKYEQGPYQPAAVSGELMEIYQEALEGK